ncbi:MAG: Aldehyde reductase YahK [Chlamydiae bacterium]|nr:Aldehyde reductase YahK [Chlamydiota bacterium]
MVKSIGYAALNSKDPLSTFNFERRCLRENDIFIEILYCGVCHSDIFQVKNGWKKSIYPLVPGHEIIGLVKEVGPKVKKIRKGEAVGVGVLVDSCMNCRNCKEDLEQYCESGPVSTYNGKDYETGEITYGGYSNNIIVREEFVLKIPKNLNLAAAAPLLCAGITTYSPLNHWNVGSESRVGIIGLGGLGHMAIKFAKAKGASVTLFTTSENKIESAKQLGADEVILSKNNSEMEGKQKALDFILNTVGAPIDLTPYLNCLSRDGVMVVVGLPDKQHPAISLDNLVFHRRSLAGSLIGGIKETQEMLNFCGKHKIVSNIELINIENINEAFERTEKGDVQYRFVIDMKSLPNK